MQEITITFLRLPLGYVLLQKFYALPFCHTPEPVPQEWLATQPLGMVQPIRRVEPIYTIITTQTDVHQQILYA